MTEQTGIRTPQKHSALPDAVQEKFRRALHEHYKRYAAQATSPLAACAYLAQALADADGNNPTWQAEYPHQVLFNGMDVSRRLALAISRLSKQHTPRKRKPHVYVPVPDEETRDRIHRNIPADERYISLDMLAAHEEAA